VKDPDQPGSTVAIVACPHAAFLPGLVAAGCWREHYAGAEQPPSALRCMVHLGPRDVVCAPEYGAWLARFPPSVCHVVVRATRACLHPRTPTPTHARLHPAQHLAPSVHPCTETSLHGRAGHGVVVAIAAAAVVAVVCRPTARRSGPGTFGRTCYGSSPASPSPPACTSHPACTPSAPRCSRGRHHWRPWAGLPRVRWTRASTPSPAPAQWMGWQRAWTAPVAARAASTVPWPIWWCVGMRTCPPRPTSSARVREKKRALFLGKSLHLPPRRMVRASWEQPCNRARVKYEAAAWGVCGGGAARSMTPTHLPPTPPLAITTTASPPSLPLPPPSPSHAHHAPDPPTLPLCPLIPPPPPPVPLSPCPPVCSRPCTRTWWSPHGCGARTSAARCRRARWATWVTAPWRPHPRPHRCTRPAALWTPRRAWCSWAPAPQCRPSTGTVRLTPLPTTARTRCVAFFVMLRLPWRLFVPLLLGSRLLLPPGWR
jgi:hypothetical protein